MAWLMLLAACGPRGGATDLPPPPDAVLPPCDAPQSWPLGRTLTQAEVENRWGRDRSALRRCAESHHLLIEWHRQMRDAVP